MLRCKTLVWPATRRVLRLAWHLVCKRPIVQVILPRLLSDCLYELAYWSELYRLRYAMDGGDPSQDASAREHYAFRRLAEIRPRDKAEAIDVLRYLADDRMDRKETEDILMNLIG